MRSASDNAHRLYGFALCLFVLKFLIFVQKTTNAPNYHHWKQCLYCGHIGTSQNIKRHSSRHGNPSIADLGNRSDWKTRKLHDQGLWCDSSPLPLHLDDAERFTGAVADTIFDYCVMRFMAGQRVPAQFDRIGLLAFNELFIYKGLCKEPELTKPAQCWEEAKLEIC